MSDQTGGNGHMDPAAWSQAMTRIAEQSQRLVADFVQRNQFQSSSTADPMAIGRAFFEMTARMMADPAKLVQAQIALWQDYLNLWQATARRMLGEEAPPVIEPSQGGSPLQGRRLEREPALRFHQAVLPADRALAAVDRAAMSRVSTRRPLRRSISIPASSSTRWRPSNFVLTNPEVLRATFESGGENLVKGLQNLLDDLERGKGKLADQA